MLVIRNWLVLLEDINFLFIKAFACLTFSLHNYHLTSINLLFFLNNCLNFDSINFYSFLVVRMENFHFYQSSHTHTHTKIIVRGYYELGVSEGGGTATAARPHFELVLLCLCYLFLSQLLSILRTQNLVRFWRMETLYCCIFLLIRKNF